MWVCVPLVNSTDSFTGKKSSDNQEIWSPWWVRSRGRGAFVTNVSLQVSRFKRSHGLMVSLSYLWVGHQKPRVFDFPSTSDKVFWMRKFRYLTLHLLSDRLIHLINAIRVQCYLAACCIANLTWASHWIYGKAVLAYISSHFSPKPHWGVFRTTDDQAKAINKIEAHYRLEMSTEWDQ